MINNLRLSLFFFLPIQTLSLNSEAFSTEFDSVEAYYAAAGRVTSLGAMEDRIYIGRCFLKARPEFVEAALLRLYPDPVVGPLSGVKWIVEAAYQRTGLRADVFDYQTHFELHNQLRSGGGSGRLKGEQPQGANDLVAKYPDGDFITIKMGSTGRLYTKNFSKGSKDPGSICYFWRFAVY